MKKLLEMIKNKEALKQELAKQAEKTEDKKELEAIQEQIKAINKEITELKAAVEELKDSDGESSKDKGEGSTSGAGESRGQSFGDGESGAGFKPMGTYFMGSQRNKSTENEDVFGSLEYRQAFRNYVINGTPIPTEYLEKRASEITLVNDIGAVIPTTIMQKVVEEAYATGMILPRITQTAFQGGVKIPVSDLKPVATWIEEDTPSEEQKKTIKTNIEFSYYMLECRVSVGLLSATVSLPIFEQTIINNIKEAMTIAIENSIMSGSGSGSPQGILKEDLPTKRIISLSADKIGTVAGWAEVEAAVPLAYESGSVYIMAKSTWEKHINGATDSNGQKIGFVSLSDNQKRILNGREVILTDYIKGFDTALSGDIFAVLVKLNDYMLNSNMAMNYKKYFDEDKNKYVHKAIMIADGKMADTNGMVYIKKSTM